MRYLGAGKGEREEGMQRSGMRARVYLVGLERRRERYILEGIKGLTEVDDNRGVCWEGFCVRSRAVGACQNDAI